MASVAVVGGSTVLRVISDRTVDRPAAIIKVTAGSFLLGAALTLADMLDTSVGTALATLVAIMALVFNGPAVAKALSHIGSGTSTATIGNAMPVSQPGSVNIYVPPTTPTPGQGSGNLGGPRGGGGSGGGGSW